jgi:uncharacterized protein YbbK (DUF523 family)
MTPTTPKYLISACLLGCKCRFDGNHQERKAMLELLQTGQVIGVCPEELGGLGTPRQPCEIKDLKVLSIDGTCKTTEYDQGANNALAIAIQNNVQIAYLKSRSPMCGFGKIYDGNFTGSLTDGNGVFAQLLIANGISVVSVE